MVMSKDGHVTATGNLEEMIYEVATIVCSLGESIKGLKNCTEEQKEEFLMKFQGAMYLATMNPNDEFKPKGVVIEL